MKNKLESNFPILKPLFQRILDTYVPYRLENDFSSGNEMNLLFKELTIALRNTAVTRDRKSIRIAWGTGKGNWAEVPWIAFLDTRHPTRVISGVYCAFLFRADMSGFYLTLTQGTDERRRTGTSPTLDELRSQLIQELENRTALANASFQFDREIDLRSQLPRPKAYEKATLVHKFYGVNAIPSDDQALDDLAAILDAYDEFTSSKLPVLETDNEGELPLPGVTETAAQVELSEEAVVVDETFLDDEPAPAQYDITSYGADYDVEGLVRRLKRHDIFIPPFQREYVWNIQEASRFVESLLLGLPVPGIFLARESGSNRLLVIDGQQRLKTLQFFFERTFNPSSDPKASRKFALVKVQPQFENATYGTLAEADRVKLNDSIIHATIIKQESPKDNDTSVYHVFERLNTGGKKLSAQEIRTTIYHGPLIDLIRDLNEHQSWRTIFGRRNSRLKDQELVLRFLALFDDRAVYARPMNEFINTFTKKNRSAQAAFLSRAKNIFIRTIDLVETSIGPRAFRPERAINAAVFDSVMVGIASRLDSATTQPSGIAQAYDRLLLNEAYIKAVTQSTSDEKNVKFRLQLASDAFASL